MNELSDINKAQLEILTDNIGRILIKTMKEFEIPNYIKATFKLKDDTYKLKFEKQSK